MRGDLSAPPRHVARHVHAPHTRQPPREERHQMQIDNRVLPLECLAREPRLLVRQEPLRRLREHLFPCGIEPQRLRLLDALNLTRPRALRLGDGLRPRPAVATLALRIDPTYPITVSVFTLIDAVAR